MKKVASILGYFFVAVVAFVYFLPRYNLYFELENYLAMQKVVISDERLNDSGFALDISEGKLYYGDLKVADIDTAKINIWGLFNRFSAEGIQINSAMKQMLFGTIEDVSITHNIFNPLHVSIASKGDFGTLHGGVDLLGRHIILLLEPSVQLTKLHPFWLRQFKKTEEGYRYETQY